MDNCSHQASTCLDHLIWLQECRIKAINLHQYIHCLHTNRKFDRYISNQSHKRSFCYLDQLISTFWALYATLIQPLLSYVYAQPLFAYLKVAAKSSYWKNKCIITKSKSEIAYKIFHSLVGASFDDLIFENHANSLVHLHKYKQFLTNGLNN